MRLGTFVLALALLALSGCKTASSPDSEAQEPPAERADKQAPAGSEEPGGDEATANHDEQETTEDESDWTPEVDVVCDDYEKQTSLCEETCEECQGPTPGNSCNVCAAACADKIFCKICGDQSFCEMLPAEEQ